MELLENPKCPQCSSIDVVKRGKRQLVDGIKGQRYICNSCGRSFSEHSGNRRKTQKKLPFGFMRILSTEESSLVCANGAKNLASATELKTVAGHEGRLAQYEWKLKKRGLQQNTINLRKNLLGCLVKDGADLNDTESVESVLALRDYPTPKKWLLVNAYHSYCRTFGIQWEKIKVKYQPKMPYIPTEQDCLIFIGALPRTMSIVCRTLYETGCRIGELRQIERQDVNEETCIITIQHPEKNSNPRPVRASPELIGLLKTLPQKYGSRLFNPKKGTYDGLLNRQRKMIADKLGKSQFLKMHFHTFRHARASFDLASGIPLEEIKEKLGHKSILNTEHYAHWNRVLYQQKNERYYQRAVSSDEDAGKLIEEGWAYVCNNPSNGHMLFRKPK